MVEGEAGTRPWYREPLVWMLVAIPGSAVVMGVVMITLAVISYDGLVEDDYYKKGMQIDRSLARDAAATGLELNAVFEFTASGRLEVTVTGNERFRPPAAIEVRFLNATRSGEDAVLTLPAVDPGRYRARAAPPGPGLWNVVLEHGLWRLTGRVPADRGRFEIGHLPGV